MMGNCQVRFLGEVRVVIPNPYPTDHIIRTSLGGTEKVNNKQLLHRHCHDHKTTCDKQVVGNKELERYIEQNPF
ncbi:MAG: HNH endonuclease [Phormidium sp.]